MTKPLWQNWRMRWHTRAATWLMLTSSTVALAGDLSSIGEESRTGVTAANPSDPPATASLVPTTPLFEQVTPPLEQTTPLVDQTTTTLDQTTTALEQTMLDQSTTALDSDALQSEAVESHAVEEPPITPLDEPPSEPWEPPTEFSEPPSEPWVPPLATPGDDNTAPPPSEPASEMVEDLEAVWSEGFEAAPAPQLSPTSGATNATPYAPTTAELSRQLLPTVRKAYGLAQHGAVYAAQTEFIQVLRRIAEAKDATEGVDTHAQALAAGLRALDEADDFAPRGAQLEAEMNVAVIVSAHRTPVLHDRAATARPAEAIALYHQFARDELAQAVAGEQAGSMALYGLGKVQNRLAREADGELRHERKALTMFLAALDAGPGNHLAANEIGVLLTRGGHPEEAAALFRRTIDAAPTSTSYHNLAVVERTLGYHEQAAANEQYAQYLAARDRVAGAASRASGVQWVAPQELSRVAQPLPIEADQNRMTNAPQRLPQPPATGPVETVAKWPQKLVPGVFRR